MEKLVVQLSNLFVSQSLPALLGLAGALVLVIISRKYIFKSRMDLFAMWSDTRMVVYTAVTGALYIAVMVPFKAFPLVPGWTEIRPGVALPLFLSFLFGPAAAWGAAIGNFIADFFGMLGPGSLFGFFGNLLLAYAPYAIYRSLIGNRSPAQSGIKAILIAGGSIVIGSFACATFIAWGADLIGMVPFAVLAPIIAINDVLVGLVLALPLILALHSRAERLGIAYYEVMDPASVKPAKTAKLGALLFSIGAIGGLAIGMFFSVEGMDVPSTQQPKTVVQTDQVQPYDVQTTTESDRTEPAPPMKIRSRAPGTLTVGTAVSPAILLMLIGMVLL